MEKHDRGYVRVNGHPHAMRYQDPETGAYVDSSKGVTTRAYIALKSITDRPITKPALRAMLLNGSIDRRRLPHNVGGGCYSEWLRWAGLPELDRVPGRKRVIHVPWAPTEEEFIQNAKRAWGKKHCGEESR